MTVSDQDGSFDPVSAAGLLQAATQQARRSMEVRTPLLYAGWGLAWLVGPGAMWLSVRDQHPYRGPSEASTAVMAGLIGVALAVTAVVVIRATRGVEGGSQTQGRMFGATWSVGFGALFALQAALARLGASDEVAGLVGAAGPLLVTGLIYMASAGIWIDRPMFVTGTWLVLVVAVGAWTGPVTLLLVEAIGAGGGFLLLAGYLARPGHR